MVDLDDGVRRPGGPGDLLPLLGALKAHLFYVIMLILACGVLVGIIKQAAYRPPPLAYTQDEYALPRLVYAPGEMLMVPVGLTIQHAGSIFVRRGFRTLPKHEWARLCDGSLSQTLELMPPPYSKDAIDTVISSTVSMPVPLLPPGDYEFTSSSRDGAGGEGVFSSRFRIEQPCPHTH